MSSLFPRSMIEPSSTKAKRMRTYREILNLGRPVLTPCDRCYARGKLCIAVENSTLSKCAECAVIGKPCVNLSWSSLDRTREDLQKKISEDEELLMAVMTRLMKNKKVLTRASERAQLKTEHLLSELDADEIQQRDEIQRTPAAMDMDADTSSLMAHPASETWDPKAYMSISEAEAFRTVRQPMHQWTCLTSDGVINQ